jgi:hypothetical protein
MRCKFLMSVLLVLCLGVPFANGQTGIANLQGTVTDESGGVLPGATVTAKNQETGTVRSVVAGQAGQYRIAALVPGLYEITAWLEGFRTQARSDVRLTVGAEATLNFTLSMGALEETLTVTGAAPLLETTRSHITTTIEEKQISELPLISRDFLSLATLVPGAGRTTTVTGLRGLQIGGSDSRYNYTTIIDGGDVDDDVWGSPVQNFMQDSIQEFQVITNRFDAQYGKALEAVVNVVSKSGTNELRGSALFFGRHEGCAPAATSRSRPDWRSRSLPSAGWAARLEVRYPATGRTSSERTSSSTPISSPWSPFRRFRHSPQTTVSFQAAPRLTS